MGGKEMRFHTGVPLNVPYVSQQGDVFCNSRTQQTPRLTKLAAWEDGQRSDGGKGINCDYRSLREVVGDACIRVQKCDGFDRLVTVSSANMML